MRLLVFGKTGQVASSIAKLCADGTIEAKFAGRETCDIIIEDHVNDLVDAFKPDVVINAAAYTAVDKAESDAEAAYGVNAAGAGNVARAAARFNIPILHISTDYVFRGDKMSAYIETDMTGPTGVYGASKLAGEKLVAEENVRHLILRTAWVYSDTGSNFVKTMLRLAADREEISVVADQIGNPTSADEIAFALLGAARKIFEHNKPDYFGVFHFSGTEKMSWADFATSIFAASSRIGGPSAKVKAITSSEYPTPTKRPENSCLDNSKFKSTFQLVQIPFSKSLEGVLGGLVQTGSSK